MSFKNLGLSNEIITAVDDLGFTKPTPIQLKAIPKIMEGFDIRASAQTGTGKTATYILPALHKLKISDQPRMMGPRVLILVPTRELAMQVAAESIKYSPHLRCAKTVCIYGGVPYPIQYRALSKPYDILVATPGRLIDHIQRNKVNLSNVEMFILDEADRMLDMGFIHAVKDIAAKIPKVRQTLMFSATLKKNVLALSDCLLTKPIEINVEPTYEEYTQIEQRLHIVDNLHHKYRLLDHLLNESTLTQVIVFTATKSHADVLVERLKETGHHAAALHGGMDQRQRTRRMLQMREGKIKILVATDVAARGLHVDTVSHVINFDLPQSTEDYVHRIGRTGRAGAKGVALSFAAYQDMYFVKEIEKFTGTKLTAMTIPGMEPKPRQAGSGDSKPRIPNRGPRRRSGHRKGPSSHNGYGKSPSNGEEQRSASSYGRQNGPSNGEAHRKGLSTQEGFRRRTKRKDRSYSKQVD